MKNNTANVATYPWICATQGGAESEVQERHRAIAEWKPRLDAMREYILLKAEMRGE